MGLDDLASNPTPRVPVCLCLDTSGSMMGSPINELNEGIKLFYDAIKDDEVALYSADIAIVTFGNGGVQIVRDFTGLSIDDSLPNLSANGGYLGSPASNHNDNRFRYSHRLGGRDFVKYCNRCGR